MIQIYWILLINSLITLFVCGWMFRYFDSVFNNQSDLLDKIIVKLQTTRDGEYSMVDSTTTITTLEDFSGESSELMKKVSKDKANIDSWGVDGSTTLTAGDE